MQIVTLTKKTNWAIITINRPDKMNALNQEVLQAISKTLDELQTDSKMRAVIITGTGEKAFVAGADISEFPSFGKVEGAKLATEGQNLVFNKIENFNLPVIAAVNGFALGGGCELAMSCHLRIASENAKFGQPEVNLGLIPGYGGTQRLVQLIGKGRALELLFTGDMISAEKAHQFGLVNHIFPQENLLEEAEKLAEKLAEKSRLAISKIIACVNKGVNHSYHEGLNNEIEAFGNSFETIDAKEGVSAFLEKRKPIFKGE